MLIPIKIFKYVFRKENFYFSKTAVTLISNVTKITQKEKSDHSNL